MTGPQPAYTCRTDSVVPGGTCYAWFPAGGVTQPPRVPNGWTWQRPATYGDTWHNQWAWEIKAAADARPGDYDIGGVKVTVVKKPKTRPLRRIAVSNSHRDASKYIATHDLELAPGIHRWDKSLSVPDGATISSAGAWIIREPNGEPGERLFVPQGGMTLDGLLLTHSPDIAPWTCIYIHQFPLKPGQVTVRNCTIRGGNLSQDQGKGWVVSDCLFERAGTGNTADHSVWLRCSFKGATRQNHNAFQNGGMPILVCSCDWENTNRGMVFSGPFHGGVIMDITIRHVVANGVLSGSECVLLETSPGVQLAGGMTDSAFVDVCIQGCAGPGLNLYGGGMHGLRFYNLNIDVESTGIMLCELGGGEMDDNLFSNVQTTGGMDIRGNVGRVRLENFHFLERVQGRSNQGPWKVNYEHFNTHWPFYLDDTAKQLATFTFAGCGVVDRDRKYRELTDVK